ncbi:MAG TPA: DUF6069 family protein [Trebonia sp.]|jgi:hypothetical protein
MTYPASPSDTVPGRVRPDAAQFWAGAAATAVVAALIALVGILVCRWTLNIPIMAPAGAGAWGNAHTGVYAVVAALVALVAAGVLYLLMLSTPQPGLFFHWIMGLATVAAVVYPFSTSAPLDQKAATAVVDLVLGLAITSLLNAVGARARRRVTPSYAAQAGYRSAPGEVPAAQQGYPAGPGYPAEEGYGSDPGYGSDSGYAPGPGYVPGQRRVEPPTRPIDTPQRRGPRR